MRHWQQFSFSLRESLSNSNCDKGVVHDELAAQSRYAHIQGSDTSATAVFSQLFEVVLDFVYLLKNIFFFNCS